MTSDTISYLQQLKLPQDVLNLELSMPFGDENKYITIHVPEKFKTFELLHITDVQFGHKVCNVSKFEEYRDWVLSKPNRFVLFGGDMIDAATLISVGSPHDNTGEPQDQIYQFCKMAAPFRHRVIGYVSGNHERRGIKTFGDLGKLIATFLRIPYSSGKQFIDIHYGQHKPFKIAMHHGVGAAGTKGARLNMLERFMKQGNAHLYLVGHLHDVLMTSSVRERQEKGQIIEEEYAGVMSSSFLRNFGTYAEVAMLPGNTVKMWRAILEPNGHWELTAKFNIEK
jgi:hypothetical protein